MQETQQVDAMQTLFSVPGELRGKDTFQKESEVQCREHKKGERSAMGKVIEMKLPLQRTEAMYLTGRTLLIIADIRGKVLFDTTGTPVLEEEFYEVTSDGIERVA